MESQQVYECFTEEMVNGFYEFLVKLVNSDYRFVDRQFFDKLHRIAQILQQLLEKSSSSQQTTMSSNAPKADEALSPGSVKRRKLLPCDPDDSFERAVMNFRERKEDSTSETSSVSNGLKDLFKTDYPEECFQTEVNEKESYHTSKSFIDPEVRVSSLKLSPSEAESDLYAYIVEIRKNVYQCQVCLSGEMSKHNLDRHVNGKQHKLASMREEKSQLQLREVDSQKSISKAEDPTMFACDLCNIKNITCLKNYEDYMNGKQHGRKLRNSRLDG